MTNNSSLIAIITLSLLILTLSPISSAQFINDIRGNPLKNGGTYAIVRNNNAPDAGSLSWTNKTANSCPLYIIEGQIPISADDSPPPNQFTPPGYSWVTVRSPVKSTFIPLSAAFDITFNSTNTPCKSQPLRWSVKPVGSVKNAFYLVAGYYKTGSFKVVVAPGNVGDNVYRLEYCFDQSKQCLQVGNFANDQIFGITSDPKVKHFPLDCFFNSPS